MNVPGVTSNYPIDYSNWYEDVLANNHSDEKIRRLAKKAEEILLLDEDIQPNDLNRITELYSRVYKQYAQVVDYNADREYGGKAVDEERFFYYIYKGIRAFRGECLSQLVIHVLIPWFSSYITNITDRKMLDGLREPRPRGRSQSRCEGRPGQASATPPSRSSRIACVSTGMEAGSESSNNQHYTGEISLS